MGNHVELTFSEQTTNNDLFCQFDDRNGVLLLDMTNPFSTKDFEIIANIITPYFEEKSELKGLIIHSKKFLRWRNPQNRAEYINFARQHHHKFDKVALSMGGFFTKVLARLAKDRIHPELKVFKYDKVSDAQDWILGWKKK